MNAAGRKIAATKIATLQEYGLVRQLDANCARQLGWELSDHSQCESLVDILCAYYDDDEFGEERCEHDRFIKHDWRYGQETSDVVAELCQIVGEPALKQVGYRTEAGHSILGVRKQDGTGVSVLVKSLDDVIALYNKILLESRDPRRFFALSTDGDFHAYYLLDIEVADRLANADVLLIADLPASVDPAIDLREFQAWPGEVRPAGVQRLDIPEGITRFCGSVALVRESGANGFFATADLESIWPVIFAITRKECATRVVKSRNGNLVVFKSNADERPLKCSLFVRKENGWMELQLPNDVSRSSLEKGIIDFYQERVVFLPQASGLQKPLIQHGARLEIITELPVETLAPPPPPPKTWLERQMASGYREDHPAFQSGLIRLRNGEDIVIWNGNGYVLRNEVWKLTFPLELKFVSLSLSGVSSGEEGFYFIDDFALFEVQPGQPKRQLMDRQFTHVQAGPASTLLLTYSSDGQAKGNAALLLEPQSGKQSVVTHKMFGEPYNSFVPNIYYSKTNKLVIAHYENNLLALPINQLMPI